MLLKQEYQNTQNTCKYCTNCNLDPDTGELTCLKNTPNFTDITGCIQFNLGPRQTRPLYKLANDLT